MRHPRIIIASISLAAAAALGGGITAATATSSHASPPAASQPAPAAVRTAPATVAGKTETILVNGHGQPLYFYRPDTATTSSRGPASAGRSKCPALIGACAGGKPSGDSKVIVPSWIGLPSNDTSPQTCIVLGPVGWEQPARATSASCSPSIAKPSR